MKTALAIFLTNGNIVITGDNIFKVFDSISQAVNYCNDKGIEARMLKTYNHEAKNHQNIKRTGY